MRDPSLDDTTWRAIRASREDVRELRAHLGGALDRISALERATPEARRLQVEADLAAADLAESGYDWPGTERDPQCGPPGETAVHHGLACRHGHHEGAAGGCTDPSCNCGCHEEMEPDDPPEPEPCDPGPEVDDQRGMSECRYILPEDHGRSGGAS